MNEQEKTTPETGSPQDKKQEKEMVDLMVAKQQMEEMEAKVREYEDIAKRSRAEAENMRKRLEREKADYVKYANRKILVHFLEFVDDFERALKTEPREIGVFYDGIGVIHRRLIAFLESYGIREIVALNMAFEPTIHQAISMEEGDYKQETVIEVYQKGYRMYDDVVRPCRVKVGKPKETGERKEHGAAAPQAPGNDMNARHDAVEGVVSQN
jgi:molecular chaperone GrpE